jgi:hypothetical protein
MPIQKDEVKAQYCALDSNPAAFGPIDQMCLLTGLDSAVSTLPTNQAGK